VNTDRQFDVARVRGEFPLLHQEVNGRPLVYLDNAATTQKPRSVIDALDAYYEQDNANVHRGVHALAERATAAFESARRKVVEFVNAASPREIVWTRGTTESINLVAQSFGASNLREGDEILLSAMEHHSNIVPWQLIAQRTGARIKVVPVTADGELDLDAFASLLTDATRIVALVHVSNVLGTINPVEDICRRAHDVGAVVVLDGAQAAPHLSIDMQAIDCDFYAFSGHKMYAPTGIGVLYGREALLDAMPPWQSGGEMIHTVSFEGTTFNELPYKFEAGTPNIADAIGMGAAIDFIGALERAAILEHEERIRKLTESLLNQNEDVRLVGTAAAKAGVVSFLLEGAHPSDVGTLLDQQGIAVRTGHHCAMPLMECLALPGTVRASFGMYNSEEDVHRLVDAIAKVRSFL
jgi:cysteine desulfurase/selenocysteine lyase